MSLEEIRSRIDAAATRAGRSPSGIELIAVSKVQPLERVEAILLQGHRIFGENRVQEAASKWPAFRDRFDGISLHLIGPLQTNKARQAMGTAVQRVQDLAMLVIHACLLGLEVQD